jgi:hypothetical protein
LGDRAALVGLDEPALGRGQALDVVGRLLNQGLLLGVSGAGRGLAGWAKAGAARPATAGGEQEAAGL